MAKKTLKIDLKGLKNRAEKDIEKSKDLKGLNQVFKQYLDKKGKLSEVLRSLKTMPRAERAKLGKQANDLKNELKKSIKEKSQRIKDKELRESYDKEWIDITAPGKKLALGHLHPMTYVKREAEQIFQLMGFSVVEGPEVENEWYNFDALNIPKDHPARDLWDTFWLKNGMLLRTHTSPVQIRYMEKNNPPLKIIAPGRIFRHEATDAYHEFNFYQLEGLMVDKHISAANFKAIIEEFYKRFFKKPVKVRIGPCFYPFTEPSFQVHMTCTVCMGKGCPTCGKTGWLEMMGAGMVHPNVLDNAGINSKNWQGFAFGMGLDRLVMMKYKINDIRHLYKSDLRFLKQF